MKQVQSLVDIYIRQEKKKTVQAVTVPSEIGCLHLVTQIWSSGNQEQSLPSCTSQLTSDMAVALMCCQPNQLKRRFSRSKYPQLLKLVLM